MATSNLKNMAGDSSNTNVKKGDLYKINPLVLKEEEGFNLRDYNDPDVVAHIEKLAEIYASGEQVLPPLIVRTNDVGDIIVVEGHCRRRAALLAIERGHDIGYLPAVNFRGNDSDRVQYMLASAEGLSLKPLEVAMGYKRLSHMGFSQTEIAKKVHKTPSHVEQMLLLANANTDVHQLVKNGSVSPTLAIEIIRKMGEKAGEYLKEKLKEATDSGKRTVTNKSIKPWMPPKKLVGSALGSVKELTEHLSEEVKTQLSQWQQNGEDLHSKTVSISAADLAALLQVANEIESKRPVVQENLSLAAGDEDE